MTVKPTVSLTDHGHAFARSLVDGGRFASLSAVIQHGLGLVEREEEEHRARLDAIRADLDRRAAEPPITMDELDQLLADWRAKRESSAA